MFHGEKKKKIIKAAAALCSCVFRSCRYINKIYIPVINIIFHGENKKKKQNKTLTIFKPPVTDFNGTVRRVPVGGGEEGKMRGRGAEEEGKGGTIMIL